MSRIVIAGRTQMRGGHVCIGGHDLDDRFRAVRLLNPFGRNWSSDAPFMVGETWDVRYRKMTCSPPHVEDVIVRKHRCLAPAVDLKALVLRNVHPWRGPPDALFDGTVRSTLSGTAYIPARGPLPRCSTGYWVPDAPVERHVFPDRIRFMSTAESSIKRFAWVGVSDPPERIAKGSLVRVSLSRRFGTETAPEGYYVQISGVL